jgi:5-methylcytosine-specific restriction endonuclease McrA
MSYNISMKELTRDERIVGLYKALHPATEIARDFGISDRQVQRIVYKAGVSRTQSESYRLAIEQGRMKYIRIPEHLKQHRKRLSDKTRYLVLSRDNFRCVTCGGTAQDCHRIEIDHIDNDPSNNDISNLQTLCSRCNKGKAWATAAS